MSVPRDIDRQKVSFVYNRSQSYLEYYFQNSDSGFNFSLSDLFETDTRKINPLIIFILIECSILLENLKLREIKSFKNTDLEIHFKIVSKEIDEYERKSQ